MGPRLPVRLWLNIQETAATYDEAQWGSQSLLTEGVAKIPHPPLLVLFKGNKGCHREGLSIQPESYPGHLGSWSHD